MIQTLGKKVLDKRYIELVSMPVRAFLDSDINLSRLARRRSTTVSMPVRAFLDSDPFFPPPEEPAEQRFNARQGIS